MNESSSSALERENLYQSNMAISTNTNMKISFSLDRFRELKRNFPGSLHFRWVNLHRHHSSGDLASGWIHYFHSIAVADPATDCHCCNPDFHSFLKIFQLISLTDKLIYWILMFLRLFD